MAEDKKTGSVRDLPTEVLDVAHRVWLAGLGALATAQEGSDRLFRQLVDRGREMEGEGREKVREAGESAKSAAEGVRETARGAAERAREGVRGVGGSFDATVGAVLQRLGVPTRDEIHELTRRIEDLNTQVERLRTAPAAPPARATPATPPKPPPITGSPVPSPATRPLPKGSVGPAAGGGARKPAGGGAKKPATGGAASGPAKKPGSGEGGA